MWGAGDRSRTQVTCPACGRSLSGDEAREYDKHGDRWTRRDKTFEYFCRDCHDALSHRRRDGLEDLLVDINAGGCTTSEFLSRYWRAVEARDEPVEER